MAQAGGRGLRARQELMKEVFSPVILVVATADVQSLCQRNNLSFAELLQPFSSVSVTLRNEPQLMTVRFTTLDGLAQPNLRTAQRTTSEAVSDAAPTDGPPPSELRDYETPWFDAYRSAFFQLVRPSEHEFLNHPTSCIVAVSTTNPNPLEAIAKAFDPDSPPPSFTEAGLNPGLLRHHVLVHDSSTVSVDKVEKIYEEMCTMLGPGTCSLLMINSRRETLHPTGSSAVPVVPDLWTPVLSRSLRRQETQVLQKKHGHRRQLSTGSGTFHIQSGQARPSASIAESDAEHPGHGEPGSITPQAEIISDPLGADPLGAVVVSEEQSPTGGAAAAVAGEAGGADDAAAATAADDDEDEKGVAVPHEPCGAALLSEDIDRVREFIRAFVNERMLPYMEQVTHQLTHALGSRKGLRHSLLGSAKKWFGGSSTRSPGSPGSPNHGQRQGSGPYLTTSPEVQTRKLADFAFMLQDYQAALQAYDSARKDFRNDKAYKHFAGAQEMMAVTTFMLTPMRGEINRYLDGALEFYLKSNTSLYATRTALLAAEIIQARGQFREAAAMLIRMTGEESDLRSALFLEQAALCFLRAEPVHRRRAAFHLVLAGHRFSKCLQRRHTMRCYQLANALYQHCQWRLADDHNNFTIGRHAYQLGLVAEALDAFSKLFAHQQQLPFQQELYLREYLAVCRQLQATGTPAERAAAQSLPLPQVNDQSISVRLRSASSPAPLAPTGASDELWLELETRIVEKLRKSKTVVSHPSFFGPRSDNTRRPVGVVQEAITLTVAFKNPLQVPLTVSNLRLRCLFTSHTSPTGAPAEGERPQPSTPEQLALERIDSLQIEPRATRLVQLSVTPRQAGALVIEGLEYDLDEGVHGVHTFAVRGRRLNRTLKERSAVVFGADHRLEPTVVPPMPFLHLKFNHLNAHALLGQIIGSTLQLTNIGNTALTRLAVACSHPMLVVYGQPTVLASTDKPPDGPPPTYTAAAGQAAASAATATAAASVAQPWPHGDQENPPAVVEFDLPEGGLEAGMSITVPVWFRPRQPGDSRVHFVTFYEATAAPARLPYRTLRSTVTFSTGYSAKMSARTHRVPHQLDKVFLELHLENTSHSRLHLRQISLLSRDWRLEGPCGHGTDCLGNPVPSTPSAATGGAAEATELDEKQVLASHFVLSKIRSGAPPANLTNDMVADSTAETQHGKHKDKHKDKHKEGAVVPADETQDACADVYPDLVISSCNMAPRELMGERPPLLDVVASPCAAFFTRAAPKKHRPATDGHARLLLIWETADRQTAGQISLNIAFDLIPGADRVPNEGEGVMFGLSHPAQIEHDFSASPMCRVPVQLTLRHIPSAHKGSGGDDDDLIFLELMPPSVRHRSRSESIAGSPLTAQPSQQKAKRPPFVWLGKTKNRLSLADNKPQTLALHACVTAPGVYDLNTGIHVTSAGRSYASVAREGLRPPSTLTVLAKSQA